MQRADSRDLGILFFYISNYAYHQLDTFCLYQGENDYDYAKRLCKQSCKNQQNQKSSENRLLTLFAQEIEDFRTGASAKSNSDE